MLVIFAEKEVHAMKQHADERTTCRPNVDRVVVMPRLIFNTNIFSTNKAARNSNIQFVVELFYAEQQFGRFPVARADVKRQRFVMHRAIFYELRFVFRCNVFSFWELPVVRKIVLAKSPISNDLMYFIYVYNVFAFVCVLVVESQCRLVDLVV